MDKQRTCERKIRWLTQAAQLLVTVPGAAWITGPWKFVWTTACVSMCTNKNIPPGYLELRSTYETTKAKIGKMLVFSNYSQVCPSEAAAFVELKPLNL